MFEARDFAINHWVGRSSGELFWWNWLSGVLQTLLAARRLGFAWILRTVPPGCDRCWTLLNAPSLQRSRNSVTTNCSGEYGSSFCTSCWAMAVPSSLAADDTRGSPVRCSALGGGGIFHRSSPWIITSHHQKSQFIPIKVPWIPIKIH